MPRLTDEQLDALARRIAEDVAAAAPGWTVNNDSDPGITLLEAFAFLTENLAYRADQIPSRSRSAIDRLTAALVSLRHPAAAAWGNGTRLRFFQGQLLSAPDFQTEQNYGREKRRLLGRLMLGTGIVAGLDVSVDAASTDTAPVVCIEPGLAIAADGEPLAVQQRLVCPLAAASTSGFVTLAYIERAIDPVQALGTVETDGSAPTEYSRIEEGVAVDFAAAVREGSVAIARLARTAAGWQVDPAYRPAMTRRRA